MRRVIYTIMAMALFTSCQKEETNGDLGGFWKLIQIEETATGNIKNSREGDFFWSIQLDLLSTTNNGKGRFQHIGDSLFVQMIHTPYDAMEVGLYNPKDERFGVRHLDRNAMILQSKDAVLTFKKF